MGAFDSIEAEAPCPQCGDIFYLHGNQTKFFEPDYDEQRWMRPGQWHPLAAMPAREHSEWVRIRDSADPQRFTLLLDFDDMFACTCECVCAPLLHFVHEPGRIMLERAELLDARTEIASRVDFCDGIPMWTGSWDTYQPELRAFEKLPFAVRAAQLHAALSARFAYDPDDEIAPWTSLVGPTRCEACGDTRERMNHTMLTHPEPDWGAFFGPDWRGGAIMIGERVPFDETHVKGRTVCLRAPGDTVTVLGSPSWWGCRCGAGRVRYVARFDRVPGGLVLVDLALRATDDMSDVDYHEP